MKVTAGKPKVGGYVFTADATATAPTDATTALGNDFTDLGYISEDGVTKNVSVSSSNIFDWGGDVVLVTQDEKTATFKFKLIEYLNADVQKFVNGSGNVTGTPEGNDGMAVSVDGSEPEEKMLVFQTTARGNVAHRVVVPRCKISEMAEVVFKRNEVVGYEVTVVAIKGTDGSFFKEYFKAA